MILTKFVECGRLIEYYIIPRNTRLLQYGSIPKSSNPIHTNGIIFILREKYEGRK